MAINTAPLVGKWLIAPAIALPIPYALETDSFQNQIRWVSVIA
jgi:hypothetical protein